jgi:hypothetical protein
MAENKTKSIRIPKRLKPWEDIVLDLRELVEEAKKYGEAEDEVGDAIFEDVELRDEDDYVKYLHEEIPTLLYRVLRALRFSGITIYHRKDDINTAEYLIEAVRGKTPYVFEINADYDDIGGRWEIFWVRVTKDAKIAEGYLPYYHEV